MKTRKEGRSRTIVKGVYLAWTEKEKTHATKVLSTAYTNNQLAPIGNAAKTAINIATESSGNEDMEMVAPAPL